MNSDGAVEPIHQIKGFPVFIGDPFCWFVKQLRLDANQLVYNFQIHHLLFFAINLPERFIFRIPVVFYQRIIYNTK